MIVLASTQLLQTGAKGKPPAANPRSFGSLFGVAVYALMCHHSIPGLVHPIRDKSELSAKLASVYVIVYLFYCALSMTGSLAFAHVQDIYTINFLVYQYLYINCFPLQFKFICKFKAWWANWWFLECHFGLFSGIISRLCLDILVYNCGHHIVQ